MINLTQYQQIFDIENTAERCKKVNDTMEQLWKSELDQLATEYLGQDYRIATYGQTLVTTYHDALNPKYAEQKKDSSIGRKYFAQIVRKVGNKEVNLLSLEFNGIEKRMYVTIDLSFYQVYELVKSSRLNAMLDELDPTIGTFTRTGSFTRNEVDHAVLGQTLSDMIKPRIRPWIYIGVALPLENKFEVSSIMEILKHTWEQTAAFRQYSLEYSEHCAKAAQIMDLLANVEETFTASLFGRPYLIQYGVTGNGNPGEREQEFSLKRDGQTIVQGCLQYREYEVRTGASRPMLAIDVEGHNHTYTNVESLIGEGVKEWRLYKSFRTKNQDNEELKQEAMELLVQHDYDVELNGYRIGSYNNAAQRFEEDVHAIKGKLVCAALLFAHVAGRGKFKLLETDAPDDASNSAGIEDSKGFVEYNSTFHFPVIHEAIQNSSLTFTKDLIRDLHLNLTALDDKHLVILSGISGTGKTQLAKLYANAVYGLPYEADNPYLSIIPVRPDWTDGTALFGYYSSFENRYMVTEFLRVVLHAHEEREKPHFIVLDEMNLARVEYYLSDYLSGVESRKEIPLHNRDDLDGIPSKISIPPNIYLIGTINVDETTHSISDKVLDRAFVMTLSDVDLETFWNRAEDGVRAGLQNEFAYLKRLHGLLAPYHLHFGYRTMNEMIKKLSGHLALDSEYQTSRMAMLDQVIAEKVLPKLKGDDRIADLLKDLKDLFTEHLGQESVSSGHIIRMEKELQRYGATQFWR